MFLINSAKPITTFTPTSTESSNFLARTSGLNNTQKTNYDTLITGLVNDSVWTKLDALYILAAPDQATANLNLCGTSYGLVTHGSPTFTANQGYTGTDASTTIYIDTQFNPSTATSPNFTQNSANVGAWANTNSQSSASGGCAIGLNNGGGYLTQLIPRYSSGNVILQLNANATGISVADASSIGYYVGVRIDVGNIILYKNASSIGTGSDTSDVVPNLNIFLLARNDSGSPTTGDGRQYSVLHFGSQLSATNVTNLNTRLGTYRTAVGL